MALNTGNEGEITKKIEDQTSKLPSTVFLGAALLAMGVSAALKCMSNDKNALFVGQWACTVPSIGHL
ncbi:hypothetical protein ACR784_18290 [Sphingobacterium multivorum]|uniref:hypothetical protein n=1 Tax=Sphingobacterium multivorum TaxID=28454 RepID=UPI003DA30CE6